MDNVSILDIGSARLKLAIAHSDSDKLNIKKFKHEVSLSNNLRDNILSESFVNGELIECLHEFKSKVVEHGCKRLLTIGTHALRQIKNSEYVIPKIERIIGKINIIPSWVEGAIFFSHIRNNISVDSICVLDIGGGSVQISFGNEENKVYSISTGTFTLENNFQKSKDRCSQNELGEMRNYIKKSLSEKNIPKKDIKLLIMGSNCMEDFVSSALAVSSPQRPIKKIGELKIESKQALRILLNEIQFIEYNKLGMYYPDNKFFMYGADKAIINLLEIADYFSIENILPTNESISTAFIDILSKCPNRLNEYNIFYTSI